MRNDADGVAHAVRVLNHVVPGHFRLAGRGRRQRGHRANQRGFSRAIWAEQAEDFSESAAKVTSFTATKSPNCFFSLVTSIALVSVALCQIH